jgi:uroporphyrin-3 C-methyltransferase
MENRVSMETEQTERSALTMAPVVASGWRATLRRPSAWLVLAALAGLGWQWWDVRQNLAELQTDVARRMTASDALLNETRTRAARSEEALRVQAAHHEILDARLAEAQAQQLALESMYQELSRHQDERLLAEIEQTVALAAQQLQLAGNVEAALIALRSADARLARAALPQLLPVRKLLNRDIDRLQALPLADVPGISLKLDGIVGVIDVLPLAFTQRAREEPLVKQQLSLNATPESTWQRLGRELWREFRQLIRIEHVERATANDAALLSPSQVFLLRENLKLRLLTARLALLQRDGKTYREDLRQASLWLERYFDIREKPVAQAVATLNELSAANLSLELPTLNDTLGGLRGFKLTREKGK